MQPRQSGSSFLTFTEEVPAALVGERLDRVVSMLSSLSRSESSRLIDAGQVHVDGEVATVRSSRLSEGQIITFSFDTDERNPALVADPSVKIDVVYADDDVIVVDKPPGLVVHPGAGNALHTLAHGLLAEFPEIAVLGESTRPGIVHRIDKGTSGLLVVARSQRAFESLSEQFASYRVEREYQALVWGHVESSEGLIDASIGRSGRDATRMVVSASGKDARTTYQVIKRYSTPAVSLLRCWLETGRTHQIRVHLSAIKHPIVGDDVYGRLRPVIPLNRPFLHASALAFDHPSTGQRINFARPLPLDLAETLAALE